ncbi:DNA-binding transcription factor [Lithospermum erythrorhizon]|uniref:DNA-binding transcription factor n=1 Tax=Lithospermum erythrorhizon TaxID=34254 RepID=A0AAV3RQE5_LITER
MMVKTEAYGGEKQRVLRNKSCIGKGDYFFRKNTHFHHLSTKSTATTNSCLITTQQKPPSCLKNVSYFPSSSSNSTSPEKMEAHLKVVGASWLMTKKRGTGIRKKAFDNLTPFTFPKLKPNNQSCSNVPHVPSFAYPLARANLKFLFEKRLQKSDVGGLKRVILPKHPAESYLPTLQSKEGFFIWMDDMDGEHCWKFKFWPNNTSRMYVLENTGDFTDEHNLEEGDHILFYQDCDTNEYVVQAKKDKDSEDSYVEYEVQDSSSDVLNDTFDDNLPSEAKSPQKQENDIVNYFVYEDGCIPEFHNDKLNNGVEVIPPYYPLLAPDEGEDGDDDIDKYLCLEGPESSKNSAVDACNGILPPELEALIKKDEKGKGATHEDKGTPIDNANKVANNLLPLEHDISPKGGDTSTSTVKAAAGIPDGFFLYAPENIPEGITYKVDEWGMPYGYETSNDPYLDFGSTDGF